MPSPLDSLSLPNNVTAPRTLLLAREAEHAAELQAARNGLKDQALQIEQLKARLAKLLRQRFGSSSEKMKGAIDQLELIIGDLETDLAETSPSIPEPEPEPPAIEPDIQTRRRKPKRKPLPENLPRDVVAHPAACACPKCGGALRRLGEDVTEVLEYIPGSFRVTRHVRPKMSCRYCESITQPPAPNLPINRGLAGPGLLAHVLVGKFCDHLPLHRQAEIFARGGIDLDRSTLADWIGQCARLLRPLVEAVGAHVMAVVRVHADDTTVPVLSPGNGKTSTGRLWCYVRDDHPFGGKAPKAVLYCYSPNRKGEHPKAHLAGFKGILQADGYPGYAGLYQQGVTEAACMAHVRRKFFGIHAKTKSPRSNEALQRIAALYAVEAWIRGEPAEIRLRVRTQRSAPLFAELRTWLDTTLSRVSGRSEMAKAIRYALARWDALTLVLRDGRACVDNNAAERSMRPMTLRRNYVRSRIMRCSCWRRLTRPNAASDFPRQRPGHNSEASEEEHQLIRRPISYGRGFDRLQSGECAVLHREVRLQVHVRRRRTLVTEPESDHRDVDAGLKHVHGGGVADRVRRYRAAGYPGLAYGGADNREVQALRDVRTRQLSSVPVWKQKRLWPGIIQSLYPVPNQQGGGFPERYASVLASLPQEMNGR
jgi:transposase